jgi:spectinomycin phosphotransferase
LDIVACLRERHGLADPNLEFLPIGHDASAWVYRVTTRDQATYFLKVRRGPIEPLSLTVPRALMSAGVASVAAPMPTSDRLELAATIGDYSLVLYPFIEGATAMAQGLSEAQWVAYGTMLRAIHQARLPDALVQALPRETFQSAWAAGVRRIRERLEHHTDGDPFVWALATIWRAHHAQIAHILSQTEVLGRQRRGQPPELVLCHTDPHLNNVLVDGRGRLFLVDWDAPRLSPKERDLHFVVASAIGTRPIGPQQEALILRGYGPALLDGVALRYFRYEWLCGDLLALADDVLTSGGSGAYSKAEAVERTRSMFAPGRALASANQLERRLASSP